MAVLELLNLDHIHSTENEGYMRGSKEEVREESGCPEKRLQQKHGS